MMKKNNASNGLILTGGGARAAYQVGVLKALAEWLPDNARNPFPVLAGTSAGSINTALLAAGAQDFRQAVKHLDALWSNLSIERVFKADFMSMLRSSGRWLLWLIMMRRARFAPKSLLDNSPLRDMLAEEIDFPEIQRSIDSGALDAVAITAASYASARSVTFFQGKFGLVSWSRTRRDGVMQPLHLEHVMASIALPLLFPAVKVGAEYFGDGSMRQGAPLSPPIHLGANRLLVIGTRNEDPNTRNYSEKISYPSFGEIGGFVLDSLFMDSLYTDIERLRRVNELIRQLGGRASGSVQPLREIDVTVLVPSEDIREITQRHYRRLPRTMKTWLRFFGASGSKATQLSSYLLFESAFCRELIELGYHDAKVREGQLREFVDPGFSRL